MKYVQATNTGKGFITHEDRTLGHISGHASDIYAVANEHTTWISRVGGVEKTLAEAEAIVLTAAQAGWDNSNVDGETAEQKVERLGARPESVSLPK
jgi:hypothetical protein